MSTITSLNTNPIFTSPFITLFLPQALLSNYAAGCTSRSSAPRWTCFLAVVALYFVEIYRHWWLSSPISDTWVASAVGGMAFWNCVTFLDRLIIRGWDYEHYYPRAGSKDGKTQFKGSRQEFAAEAIASPRGVGTWWEVKEVPPAWSERMTMPWFLLSRSVMAVTSWTFHNILVDVVYSERYGSFVLDSHDTVLRELEVRTVTFFISWIRLWLAGNAFSLAGIVLASAFNRDHFASARPMFGSIGRAFTLRGIWGSFWHQNIRSGCEGTGDFIVHHWLCLPRRGLVPSILKMFWSFALSGAMHLANDLALGISFRNSRAMTFFLLQGVGLMLESSVQAAWHRYIRKNTGRYEKIAGYLWITVYLGWTGAQWVYPAYRVLGKEGSYLRRNSFYPIFVNTRR